MNPKRAALVDALESAYVRLFERPDYAMAAARHTPRAMAERFADGLVTGSAANDGEGVKAACRALGIKPTYTAIRAFVASGQEG